LLVCLFVCWLVCWFVFCGFLHFSNLQHYFNEAIYNLKMQETVALIQELDSLITNANLDLSRYL
jgi:hypothetical protein